ncbi:MAG: hypothetical protein KGM91_27905 [Burkholderiales bacterium]|nr:hypothetical protein [Burkholderiales bacterium]
MPTTAKSAARALLRAAHSRLFDYMARSGLIAAAVPFAVDKLDAIPEAQRVLYKQVGDKYQLDLEGYEDPAGLKSALDKERKAARDAVAMTKAWKDLGKTPEEITALLEAQAQAERDKLTKAGEWDKLRKQMDDQHQAALETERQGKAALRAQLERHLVDAAGVAAIASAKGNAELLLPHVKSRVKVIEDNGEFTVRVVDAAGNPRVNAKGEFLSMTDLVGEMRSHDTFAAAFAAPNASGGGARQSGGSAGAKTITRADFDALDGAAKFSAIKAGTAVID